MAKAKPHVYRVREQGFTAQRKCGKCQTHLIPNNSGNPESRRSVCDYCLDLKQRDVLLGEAVDLLSDNLGFLKLLRDEWKTYRTSSSRHKAAKYQALNTLIRLTSEVVKREKP